MSIAARRLSRRNVATPGTQTIWGSCPVGGGTSLAAAQTVVTKWGSGVSVRQFFVDFADGPRFPTGAPLVHDSFKPDVASLIAGTLDSSITAWVNGISVPQGVTFCVEVWHELDKKVRDGVIVLADGIAAKNRFYDLVKAANPSIKVVSTYTGWLFEPSSGLDPSIYTPAKCDWLGIDLDGINPTNGNYPSFTSEISSMDSWVLQTANCTGWCVPEFGSPRDLTYDVNGDLRAVWMSNHGPLLGGNARYVCNFEYPSGGAQYELTTSSEIAAWAALVATNPA